MSGAQTLMNISLQHGSEKALTGNRRHNLVWEERFRDSTYSKQAARFLLGRRQHLVTLGKPIIPVKTSRFFADRHFRVGH